MKHVLLLIIPSLLLMSCGGDAKKQDQNAAPPAKISAVAVTELVPTQFNANIEIQAQVNGDENVVATPQAPGTVKSILVHTGQKVGKGQLLATLDVATLDHQIETLSPQLALTKSLYEKQQNLWAQNIGSEVQLLSAKTNYESVGKQIAALKSQRDMYRIVSPISGVVDALPLKVGDMASPGFSGIRVVSYDKMKVEAMLGENYLGKVNPGDKVTILFPDFGDSINTTLSYVSQSVDPMSRSFTVQVQLSNAKRVHPNMSCVMRIAHYTTSSAIVVPVGVIQKTESDQHVFVATGNKAKEVKVTVGRISNGKAEILSGLNTGDKLITAGYDELENGQTIAIQ
jgi:membrane fusion protein, multidrug efflux system